ncbi:hypothetical protein [Gilvimarinus chinensis]|uniref:hypothetical protein n=1 Tax=Gilvimarinus chinensis TaxID=396005 RepID=UPI00037ED141|nr:hypothetical protein [Gilvimarinus chinensis]
MDVNQFKTMNVAYIGRKAVKRDTVCGTATLWSGYGDIQEVSHGVGTRLLRHPDVWVSEKAFKEQYPDELEQPVKTPTGQGFSLPASDSDFDEGGELDEQEEGGDEDTDIDADNADNDTDTDGQDKSEDPQAAAIKNAILSLDQENLEHFSEKGNPRIGAIRAAASDESISPGQVKSVWASMQ